MSGKYKEGATFQSTRCRQLFLQDRGCTVNFLFGIEDMHREPDAVETEFSVSRSDDDLVFIEKHLHEALSRKLFSKEQREHR